MEALSLPFLQIALATHLPSPVEDSGTFDSLIAVEMLRDFSTN